MRQYFAAGLIASFGLLFLWIGVAGRMGVLLGALLCPAQLQADNPDAQLVYNGDGTFTTPGEDTSRGGGGGTSGGF